jgi:hypothetical protein
MMRSPWLTGRGVAPYRGGTLQVRHFSSPLERTPLPVSRHRIVCVLLGAGVLATSLTGPAHAATQAGSSGARCSAATYVPVHSLPTLHRGPRVTFFRQLTVAAHSTRRNITWSAPSSAPVIAGARTSSGAHVTADWIWRDVARRYSEPVASSGHRTPRTETSNGPQQARNTTGRARHYIEFDGFTRFHGWFAVTNCAGVNQHGIGHLARSHGTWVTFSKVEQTGLALCGAGSGNNAIAKAALAHCP